MYYILGLGNPGEKYNDTRHNVGRSLVETLQEQGDFSDWVNDNAAAALKADGSLANQPAGLLLPETFMNRSGDTAAYLVNKQGAKLSELIVVHDDIDLPLGEVKISVGKGAGGNNGVASIIAAVGKDFVRVRVGIARQSFWTKKTVRPTGPALNRYVLGRFTRGESNKLEKIGNEVQRALALIVEKGAASAMNKFN